MSNFTQQLQKMKTDPGFIAALDQSGGSTPGALKSYGIKENAWSNEDEMFAIVHQMRSHYYQPQLHRQADSWRYPVREHHGQGHRGAAYLRTISGMKTRCAFSESGQGPSSGEGRGPIDEAHARAWRAARQGQSEGHIRNQDALGHQASQRRRHQEHRESAVPSSSADHHRWSRADHRARSGYSRCPEKAKAEELLKRRSSRSSTNC